MRNDECKTAQVRKEIERYVKNNKYEPKFREKMMEKYNCSKALVSHLLRNVNYPKRNRIYDKYREKINKLYKQTNCVEEIAEQVKCGVCFVTYYLNSQDMPFTHKVVYSQNIDRYKYIFDNMGMSTTQLARELKMTQSGLCHFMERHNVPYIADWLKRKGDVNVILDTYRKLFALISKYNTADAPIYKEKLQGLTVEHLLEVGNKAYFNYNRKINKSKMVAEYIAKHQNDNIVANDILNEIKTSMSVITRIVKQLNKEEKIKIPESLWLSLGLKRKKLKSI